jgi:hypothetical protein
MIILDNNLNDIQEIGLIAKNQDVNIDLILMICGKKLGDGHSRAVYEYNLDERYVVKIEPQNYSSNVSERLLWDEVQGLKGSMAWVKEWFAPIKYCSPNNKILIMQRTKQDYRKERPTKVPAFFHDVKEANWGWIGNKYVCHDYGSIYGFIKYEKKFKKIEW